MTFPLGWRPYRSTLYLSDQRQYRLDLYNQSGAFPPGTVCIITFSTGQSWQAIVAGDLARFVVSADDAEAIPDGTPFELTVSYPDSDNASTEETADFLWYIGNAQRVNGFQHTE